MADNTVKMTFEGVDDVSKVIKRINKGLDSYERNAKEASSASSKLGGAVKGVVGAFAGYATISSAVSFAKETIELAKIQIKAETKLEQTIRATGGAAGFTAKELKSMAAELQRNTTVGDEMIMGAQSLLLTFKNISGNVFPRVTEAVLDMSEAMGQDLKSSSIQLGKALNDPIQGVSALARVGVQFSDSQKEQIKNFISINDLASAQAVILEEVEGQFGGVARAMAETDVGEIEQINNEIGDMKEEIGRGLIPVQREFYSLVLDTAKGWQFLTKSALEFFGITKNGEQIEKISSQISGASENLAMYKNAIKEAKDGTVSLGRDGMVVFSGSVEQAQNRVEEFERRIKSLKQQYNEIAGQKLFDVTREDLPEVTAPQQPQTITGDDKTYKQKIKSGERALKEIKRLQLEEAKAIWDLNQSKKEAQKAAFEEWKAIEEEKIQAVWEYNQRQLEIEEERREKQRENTQFAAETALQVSQIIEQAFSARYAKEREEIDRNTAKKREAIKESTLSEKQKNKELDKLDKEAQKAKHELAMKDWRMNLIMSIANTALGVTKALSSSSPPLNFVMAALTGAAGAASIATIAANKPKFALGGLVPGNSFTGDQVPISANSGEIVATQSQQRRLLDVMEGRTPTSAQKSPVNVTLGDSNIIIQGNADQGTVEALERENLSHREKIAEMLYQLADSGELDTTRLPFAVA